jgi:hypothetical protein
MWTKINLNDALSFAKEMSHRSGIEHAIVKSNGYFWIASEKTIRTHFPKNNILVIKSN